MQVSRRFNAGLTLIELLVTLFVLALLLNASTPCMLYLVQQKASDVTIKHLHRAIEVARTSAITQNALVTLCRSSNSIFCGGKWQQGILVFADQDDDRNLEREDKLIRYFPFLS